MKLFLIQPTSFLHFTFQSLFKMGEVSGWLCGDLLAWVEPWQVGALATMIECWICTEGEWEHPPWLPEIQTLLLLNSFLWVLGSKSSCARDCSCPVMEPSGSINGIVVLVRPTWLVGVSCPVPVQVLGGRWHKDRLGKRAGKHGESP